MIVLLLHGRRRMMRLITTRAALPAEPPLVTILVPAKDEAGGIRQCIQRILAQDYPNFSIIAIDDRSTDGTGAILDELAAAHPAKLQVVHIVAGSLPPGWLGKCNALHVGASGAPGEWLFFVDSDVTLQPGALSRAIAVSAARKYDALSILTRLECDTFTERLVLPLAGAAWSVMYAVSLTNEDSRTNIAFANGQFFLIRKHAYEIVGGHASVRDRITEDVELMRLLKSRAFRTRFMLGSHLASTKMHSDLAQMCHGWGRIYAGSNRLNPSRIIGSILFLLACGFSAYPALLWSIIAAAGWGEFRWLAASVSHLLLMTAYLAMMYHWSGNRARYAWLFPLGGIGLLRILAFGLRTCLTGRVMWRDTHFQVPAQVPVHNSPKERSTADERA